MRRGFTLIELMVVMAIVAILMSIVAPRYFDHLERAREAALRETLVVVRDAIDKFQGDTGRYPNDLDELVSRRYLRALPIDPMAQDGEGWTVVPAPSGQPGVADIRSGAGGTERSYAHW